MRKPGFKKCDICHKAKNRSINLSIKTKTCRFDWAGVIQTYFNHLEIVEGQTKSVVETLPDSFIDLKPPFTSTSLS